MNRIPDRSAFTLMEISIVLIIIGMLAAGVTVGRTLLESTALQSVAADFDMYRNAVIGYRDKYRELPGDHTGAGTLTAQDAGCATPAASDNPFITTCNGNGDGMVGDTTGDPLGSFSNYYESLWVWQHLMNDGLIKGKYNGRPSTASTGITPGVNVPMSKIANASFMLRFFPTNTDTSGYFKASYGHVFFFGAPETSAAYPLNGAALTSEQAKSIDLKIDDGKPGLGKVLTTPQSVRACPTTDVESTAVYDSSLSTAACALIFITGF